MQVTHIITRLIVGGAQLNTVATVLGLRPKPGVEVRLLSGPSVGSEGSLEAEVSRLGLLTTVPALTRPVHPWKDVLAWRQLTRLLRGQRADIVHTHSGKAGVLGRLAAARVGVPVILHTVHGPSFGPFQGAVANWVFRSAELRAARVTHHFVSVADAMTRQYLAAGIGRPEQYTTLRSGFALEPFLAARNDAGVRARYGLAKDDFVVGKISRLFKLKGHEDLIAIAPALVRERPNVKFLLVGDGPWRDRFERRVRELGLPQHFLFTGLVAPDEVPALIGIMDAVVHLSVREGLPRALPQALAAAKPVIAYDCDGAGEVCRDDETGFLLHPGDRAGLTDRLRRLADDPALRARFGARGQALVRQQFSVERMVDDLHSLYQRLLQRQANSAPAPAAAPVNRKGPVGG
jgi:glycosyltransferase involved in cell wall biosynthesis